MKTRPSSPIQLLEARVSRLRQDKLLAFSTFCAQAAIRNIDVYLTAIKAGHSVFDERLDSWFWQKLRAGVVDLPCDYQALETELVDITNNFIGQAQHNNISPIPNPVMARESVFLFIANSSFFAERGRVPQLLTVINNCIDCKIDFFYGAELGIKVYKPGNASLSAIRSFPVYGHALVDLEWALTILERDENSWVSNETLDTLRVYANNCPTFIVDRPFYAWD